MKKNIAMLIVIGSIFNKFYDRVRVTGMISSYNSKSSGGWNISNCYYLVYDSIIFTGDKAFCCKLHDSYLCTDIRRSKLLDIPHSQLNWTSNFVQRHLLRTQSIGALSRREGQPHSPYDW